MRRYAEGGRCVDTFTRHAPGMLALVSAAVASEPGVVYGEAGVITPLTTVAARLAAKYGVSSATSNLLVALAFGRGLYFLSARSIHFFRYTTTCEQKKPRLQLDLVFVCFLYPSQPQLREKKKNHIRTQF